MGFEPVECEVLKDVLWEMGTGQLVHRSGAMGEIGGERADLGSYCNSAMSEAAEIAQGA